jgi:hypothetical protein
MQKFVKGVEASNAERICLRLLYSLGYARQGSVEAERAITRLLCKSAREASSEWYG